MRSPAFASLIMRSATILCMRSSLSVSSSATQTRAEEVRRPDKPRRQGTRGQLPAGDPYHRGWSAARRVCSTACIRRRRWRPTRRQRRYCASALSRNFPVEGGYACPVLGQRTTVVIEQIPCMCAGTSVRNVRPHNARAYMYRNVRGCRPASAQGLPSVPP